MAIIVHVSALDSIIVKGARQHNLQNIDLTVPKNKMVVFTGVSGSGKSSMAMDTIYAEGQRRYVESLSAYARQFLGVMDKPDVDSIEGLSPAIAIDQKTTSKNPRSTVGTITEVYDFLRLLYARVGHPHCHNCGMEISRQSSQQILENVMNKVRESSEFHSEKGVRLLVLSPVVKERKGEFASLISNLKKQGIYRARIDGNLRDLNDHFELLKNNKHSIDAVISRHIISANKLKDENVEKDLRSILFQSIETALKLSSGNVVIAEILDKSFDFPEFPTEMIDHLYSENFACPNCLISLEDLEPRSFSFNSPQGACPNCDGLGTQLDIDPEVIVNPNFSVSEGGVMPWAKLFDNNGWTSRVVKAVSDEYGFSLDTPIKDLTPEAKNILFYGTEENKRFQIKYKDRDGNTNSFSAKFEGIVPNLLRRHKETASEYIRAEIEKYMIHEDCTVCNGSRLKKEALSVVLDGKNIWEISELSINHLYTWANKLEQNFNERELAISSPIIKEINYRLKFLLDVGLDYLSLSRTSGHLSGGEAQRIRLASQIGSGLSGVLYVLDEPSIGLHQRDQSKLITTLHHLRDLGNTVVVVEHDTDTMLKSDYLVDFGPGAGKHGGTVISQGTPEEVQKDPNSITGKYLSGKRKVGAHQNVPNYKLSKDPSDYLVLKNATGRNLKGVDLKVPLNKLVCVTGVSGSGKSTLIMDTLLKTLRTEFGLKNDERAEPNDGLIGVSKIKNVVSIDQSPIGRTPKSNPATYTKVFDLIRDLFSKTQEARIRGYGPGRFSFNVKGGRCESCHGEGQLRIEMQFMPDVYVNCEVCQGKRYNREALEILYKGKNIADVLDMTVDEALSFFENVPPIHRKLQTLYDVGLGYVQLGQPAPTLSGGEAQRVKLALELSKKTKKGTFYILDEPTTGLHFADLENLISIFRRLTAEGSTVLVIEHNLDVIGNADYIIDLGPEGGDRGGRIIFSGAVNQLPDQSESYTVQELHKLQKASKLSS